MEDFHKQAWLWRSYWVSRRQLQRLLASEERAWLQAVVRLLQVWLLASVVLLWEVVLWADGSRSAKARQKQRRRLSDAASWHDWPLDSRGAA